MGTRRSRDSIDDVDEALADALVRRRGCAAVIAWPLLIVVLLGGGAAGYYYFRRYEAMRQTVDALAWRARSGGERIDAAERHAREAEAALARAREERAREQAESSRQRVELVTERDRLRAELAQVRASTGAPAGDGAALLARLRAAVPASAGEARADGARVVVALNAAALFRAGDATLLAGAAPALTRVAEALREARGYDVHVRVYGADGAAGAGAARGGAARGAAARFATEWDRAAAQGVAVARFLRERGGIEGARVVASVHGAAQAGARAGDAGAGAAPQRIEVVAVPASAP